MGLSLMWEVARLETVIAYGESAMYVRYLRLRTPPSLSKNIILAGWNEYLRVKAR